jgi:hypothetical protein
MQEEGAGVRDQFSDWVKMSDKCPIGWRRKGSANGRPGPSTTRGRMATVPRAPRGSREGLLADWHDCHPSHSLGEDDPKDGRRTGRGAGPLLVKKLTRRIPGAGRQRPLLVTASCCWRCLGMIIGKAIPGKVELGAGGHLAEALKTDELTAPRSGVHPARWCLGLMDANDGGTLGG